MPEGMQARIRISACVNEGTKFSNARLWEEVSFHDNRSRHLLPGLQQDGVGIGKVLFGWELPHETISLAIGINPTQKDIRVAGYPDRLIATIPNDDGKIQIVSNEGIVLACADADFDRSAWLGIVNRSNSGRHV